MAIQSEQWCAVHPDQRCEAAVLAASISPPKPHRISTLRERRVAVPERLIAVRERLGGVAAFLLPPLLDRLRDLLPGSTPNASHRACHLRPGPGRRRLAQRRAALAQYRAKCYLTPH